MWSASSSLASRAFAIVLPSSRGSRRTDKDTQKTPSSKPSVSRGAGSRQGPPQSPRVKAIGPPRPCRDGQPRLSRAAGSGQREQTSAVAKKAGDVSDLGIASDERARRTRQRRSRDASHNTPSASGAESIRPLQPLAV